MEFVSIDDMRCLEDLFVALVSLAGTLMKTKRKTSWNDKIIGGLQVSIF